MYIFIKLRYACKKEEDMMLIKEFSIIVTIEKACELRTT